MSTVRELQKLACLEALGLQLLVARKPLPGAAPSVPRVALSAAAPIRQQSPARPLAERSLTDTAPIGPSPVSVPRQEADRTSAPAPEVQPSERGFPAFHLAAIVAGGCLWLEPLAGPELEQAPLQLIRAMAFALQRRPEDPQVTRFDWPLHSNRQLDLSAAAAAAALTGFVLRQVHDRRCRAIVLLGQAAGEHLLQPELDGVPMVLLPATQDLLAQHHSKREAWQALATMRA
jgi:hypothetical protein